MMEVSEVLLLESSADDNQKWKNNKRGESSKRLPVSKQSYHGQGVLEVQMCQTSIQQIHHIISPLLVTSGQKPVQYLAMHFAPHTLTCVFSLAYLLTLKCIKA